MRLSLFELEATLKKAAIGAGFPVGLAEELSRSAAWLAGQGYDVLGPVMSALATGQSAPDDAITEGNHLVFADLAVASSGPSVIDLLIGGNIAAIRLDSIDYPVLLMGLAGLAGETHGLECSVDFGEDSFAAISGSQFTFHGALPVTSTGMIIRRGINERHAAIANQHSVISSTVGGKGVIVDDTLWRRALDLAARTYVPASDASRAAGAGAGLSDND